MDGLSNSTISVLIKILSDNTGVTQASAAIQKYQQQVKEGAGIVAGAFGVMVAATIAVGAYSIKTASDFQSSMLLIQTQAGASAAEVKKMTAAVLALAPAVGQTPQELAQGLFYVESAGYRGAQALDVLKLSAEGAAVGHDDLVSVVKALTSVMSSNVKGVKDTTQAMGVLDAIVGHGKMSMSDLTGAISTGILPAANEAGISLQDVGAALDVMTNNGVPAEEAATRLRMTLSLLAAPTATATAQLEKVGLTSRSLADDMQKGGIIAAITDLNQHMNAVQPASQVVVKGTKETAAQLGTLGNNILNTTERLKILNETTVKAGTATDKHNLAIQMAQQKLSGYEAKLGDANTVIKTLGGTTLDAVGKAQLLAGAFGGGKSSSSIEMLTQQAKALKSDLEGVNQTSGKFASSWVATQQTAAFASQKFNATIQTMAITLGDKLLPAYTEVMNILANNIIPAFTKLTQFIEKNHAALAILGGVLVGAVALGLIAVAVAAAPAIAAVGAFLATWGPVAIAIGAVAAIIFMYWGQITKATQTFVNTHKQLFTDMWTTLKSIFEFGLGFIKAFWTSTWWGVYQTAMGIWNLISGAFQVFTGLLEVIFGVFQGIFTGNWKAAWTEIKTGFMDIWNGLVTFFEGILGTLAGMLETFLSSVIGLINGVIGGINQVGSHISGVKGTIPLLPHLASGVTNFSGGMALLGEEGPEFAYLPQGTNVIPARQTQQMLQQGGSSGVVINQTNNFTTPNSAQLLLNSINYALSTVR